MALRISALKHGAIHVVLACLAIFTHQPDAIPVTDKGNQHVVSVNSRYSDHVPRVRLTIGYLNASSLS